MPGVVVIVQGEVFRSGTCRGSTCMSHGPGSAQGTRVTNGPINEQIQAFRSIQELAIDHLGALGWNVTTCVDVVSASRQRAELVQSHWASRVARCGLQVRPRVAATQMEARIEVLDSAEQHLGSLAGCAVLLVRADLILKQPLQLPRPRDEEREAAGGAIRFPFAMRGTMNGRTQTLLGNPRVADCFVWVPAAHLAHFRRILTEHRSEAHAHDFVVFPEQRNVNGTRQCPEGVSAPSNVSYGLPTESSLRAATAWGRGMVMVVSLWGQPDLSRW